MCKGIGNIVSYGFWKPIFAWMCQHSSVKFATKMAAMRRETMITVSGDRPVPHCLAHFWTLLTSIQIYFAVDK